ncbi:hypothetical protein [Azospirillum sp. TSO22-1]|uniref:hypothetical protein n=1 Tax=Azospirillum sp. TSO22-1 TaxID=716789 RepID=UPI0011B56A77|nr:hypothetical protein [Azospirillum sp. TSO22-1]
MSYDAVENLTSRASALVRQFGLDRKGHGLSDDRAATKQIDELVEAVHRLERLVDGRRKRRASGLDEAINW